VAYSGPIMLGSHSCDESVERTVLVNNTHTGWAHLDLFHA
jgi:hypothetical protein